MAIGSLLPSGYETLEDANGASVPGGLIWTYQAGTTTPQTTYSDSNLTVPNSNPIIADGAGRWFAYAPTGAAFKLVFETPAIPPAHGATIRTVDNLTGPVFTGQLSFPATQVPSSDPNTLDDYEEGAWTPVLGGNGGQSGQTYATQTGHYVKIGRHVTVTFDVTLTAKGTITGAVAAINNLPFPTTMNCGASIPYFVTLAAAKLAIFGMGQSTQITLLTLTVAAVSQGFLLPADIANTTEIAGGLAYMTTQ